MSLYLGLISGTSIDGIDAALVSLPESKIVAGLTVPYSADLKIKLKEVLTGTHKPASFFSQLSTEIGREFANVALTLLDKTRHKADEITAIGSHGQTICHDAFADIPYTVQLGCPHTIAELTKIKVVADFRTRDLVLGGQGAPFAPLYHQELFKDQTEPLAVINIGGVANVSFLDKSKPLKGFDVGPGNCLMDAWISKHKNLSFDKNGAWASTGRVRERLLAKLLTDRYFSLPAPKSLGKEYFSLTWLNSYLEPPYLPEDIQATLVAFTASAIALSLKEYEPKTLVLCGGGAHNEAIRMRLASLLPNSKIRTTEDYGLNPDFIEAALFAWLAEKALNNRALNLESLTGARAPAIMGVVYT